MGNDKFKEFEKRRKRQKSSGLKRITYDPLLSELPRNTKVAFKDTNDIYIANELIDEIIRDRVPYDTQLYTIEKYTWKPDAKKMFDSYLEDECWDLFEDADEVIERQVTNELVRKLQQVLNEDGLELEYFELRKPVVIDFENLSYIRRK